MVTDFIGLVLMGLVAMALLWLIPRSASRNWAVGLLVLGVVGNSSALLVTVIAYFSPPIVYLDTEKNQLQFNRGDKGELFGVQVNNPPVECQATDKNRPWSLALGNLMITALALVFLRRTPAPATHPGFQETGHSSTP
jgi:hypothetical protein